MFLVILLALIMVIAGPLLVLWALNMLFGLGIEYTFWTWLAVVILASAVRANVEVKKS